MTVPPEVQQAIDDLLNRWCIRATAMHLRLDADRHDSISGEELIVNRGVVRAIVAHLTNFSKLEDYTGREMDHPYFVERDPQHVTCNQCGAGSLWMVVFRPTDTSESTMYGSQDEAQDVADMLNDAFRNGKAWPR